MKVYSLLFIVNVTSLAWSCGSGCTPVGDVCACDEKPVESHTDVQAISTEKPTRNPLGACATEVHCAEPQSLAASDIKQDQEKAAADRQGKNSAGIE